MWLSLDLDFNSEALVKLITILGKYTKNFPRVVGGAVRDKILNFDVTDIDINTDLLPQEVISILTADNIKVIPTGIDFGTVTAFIGEEKFEITSLRQDIINDGRWPVVKYTKDFYLDAMRRDFTINAMSYCIKEKKLFDYFGGLVHLQSRKVMFIGYADERIKEDYLRILRFFRFSLKFADELDNDGYQASIDNRFGLTKISSERINLEFSKILDYYKIGLIDVLHEIQIGGILDVIFPNIVIDLQFFKRGIIFEEDNRLKLSLEVKYGLIFAKEYDEKKLLDSLKKLKFNNKQIKKIHNFFTLKNSKNIILALYELWYINYKDILDYVVFSKILNLIDHDFFVLHLIYFQNKPPVFPISSELLLKMGYNGVRLGKVIKYLQSKWLLSSCSFNQNELLKFLNDGEI